MKIIFKLTLAELLLLLVPNHIIDIEYQVIDGGQGDLDINFDLALDGRVLFADYKKSDNIHR